MNHKKNTLLAIVCLGLFISSPAQNIQKLSEQQIRHLALLGQMWGFLKYYHPQVAQGKFDWDQELFLKIPLVKHAKNDSALSAVLSNWIDSLGMVPACRTCNQLPEGLITYNLDEKWMTDKSFSEALQQKILYIKNNRHQGAGAYVRYSNAKTAEFLREKEYDSPEMIYPNEAFRLHFLFRYWTSINYFFPYRNLIGKDWTVALHEFVPMFAEAADTLQYQTAMTMLINGIDDTHSAMSNQYLQRAYGNLSLPVSLKIINDEAVVLGYYDEILGKGSGLERGDVIEKVNGKTVKELIDARAPLVNGSNYPSKLAALLTHNYICGGKETTVDLAVRKKSGRVEMKVTRYPRNLFTEKSSPDSLCRKLPGNIGYINLGRLTIGQVDSVMHLLKDCKAIVFDIRYNSKGTCYRIALYLLDHVRNFARMTYPNLDYPGTFLWTKYYNQVGPYNPNKNFFHYKGQVVLLVNERSISHGEWTAMALQSVPGSVTIGSQTAGADGNVIRPVWPGKVYSFITGLGVFYPDGTRAQRLGVKIDLEVHPTAEGIREGRDEVLERAIRYIQDKR